MADGLSLLYRKLTCSHPSATFAPAETGSCRQYLKKDHYVCDVCGRDLLKNDDGAYYVPESWQYKTWGPHIPTNHHDAVAPTCTTAGNIEYWVCETCGDYLLYEAADDAYYSTDPILAPWHSGLEIHRPTAATCEPTGNIAYWYCRDCGKYFEPTEYAEGQYAFDGANRELTAQDVIVPAGHTLTKTDGAPATCAADGSIDYWTCSVCHKLFADENAETEITAADVVVAAPGHRMTFVPAKDASCKADGNVAYYNCEHCGKFYADEAGNSEITDKNSVVIKKNRPRLRRMDRRASRHLRGRRCKRALCMQRLRKVF